ncbi:MAG: cobalamin biosynthesis protein [Candidatus Polarisedimenticolaceae bacterium]|nr:cobalamin biosynthesis protein [Candidatus Polarisedimenticolaceae bacterium]
MQKEKTVSRSEKIAMVAITRHGAKRLQQLGPKLPHADLYISEKFLTEVDHIPNRIEAITPPVRGAIATLFKRYDQLLFLFSIGAAVRLIAPCIHSKEEDPGVVVIDDAGHFVVPILSGHLGGANAFANQIADLIGAQPVITTASESLGTLPIDILGRELGWKNEAPKATLTKVAAHMVNGEPIAFVQECGSKAWWEKGKPLPSNIQLFDRFETIDPSQFSAILWVTRREITESTRNQLIDSLVVYRPPKPVVLGIGCDRGTALETIEQALELALSAAKLEYTSVSAIATIDKKSDEVGLLALAEKYSWPLHFYPADELAQVEVPNPSETVLKYVGTPSVGEAAALLLAGATMDKLIVEKHKYRGMDGRNATISIVPIEII